MIDNKANRVVNLKCSTQELELLKKLASESNRSFSGFVSFLVKEYLKNLNKYSDNNCENSCSGQ